MTSRRSTFVSATAASAALALIAGLSAGPLAGDALAAEMVKGPKVSWNFSGWGKKRAFTTGIEKLAELVAARTGGNFTIKVHLGGALSKPRENLDGIKLGAFQMAHFCNFYHPGKNPAFMVLALPFLPLSNWNKNVAVRDAVYKHPAFVKDMARWNAMTYSSTYLPQYEFLGKGKPPVKLSDWKGLRVRAGGGVGQAMEVLGATRTTTTATEVYTAVQRGTVDAASFPFTYSHVAYKIHEVTDWYTANLSPGTSDCPLVMNKTAWSKLPKQYQKLMMDARPQVVAAQVKAYTDIDEVNLPMLQKKLKAVRYSEAQLAAFRKAAGKPVWDKWVAANKDKFDGQSILDLIFKVAKETK